MTNTGEARQVALKHHQAGQLQQAASIYNQILQFFTQSNTVAIHDSIVIFQFYQDHSSVDHSLILYSIFLVEIPSIFAALDLLPLVV
jgi:hypothetical protein